MYHMLTMIRAIKVRTVSGTGYGFQTVPQSSPKLQSYLKRPMAHKSETITDTSRKRGFSKAVSCQNCHREENGVIGISSRFLGRSGILRALWLVVRRDNIFIALMLDERAQRRAWGQEFVGLN